MGGRGEDGGGGDGGGGTASGCPVGMGVNPRGSSGDGSCKNCGSGWFSADDTTTCTQCDEGTISPSSENTAACTECLSGTYSNSNQNACVDCGDMFSENRATVCTICQVGSIKPDAVSPCEICPAGTHELDFTHCMACPAGKFSANAGSSECTDCETGKIAANTEQTQCVSCGIGTEEIDHIRCDICPVGKFTSPTVNGCNVCQPGMVAPDEGQEECTNCAAGKYEDSRTACLICNAGTYSNNKATVCIDCSNGYISEEGAGACTACSAGKYDDLSSEDCKDCDAGTYSNAGLTVCTNCDNWYVSAKSAASCEECPSGKYMDTTCSDTFLTESDGSLKLWRDVMDNTCHDYVLNEAWCGLYGDYPGPYGIPNDNCCVCGSPNTPPNAIGLDVKKCSLCKGCGHQEYMSSCQYTSAGLCDSCKKCDSNEDIRVDCRHDAGFNENSGACIDKQFVSPTPFCPRTVSIQDELTNFAIHTTGLGGFQMIEVFGSNSRNELDFQCRDPCIAATEDTGYCGGPYACGKRICNQYNAEDNDDNYRVARACPVQMQDDYSLNLEKTKAKIETECLKCTECGSNRKSTIENLNLNSNDYIENVGLGCVTECTQMLCKMGQIYDVSDNECKSCSDLKNVILCKDDFQNDNILSTDITGNSILVDFKECIPLSSEKTDYGNCELCIHPTCTNADTFPSSCTECSECIPHESIQMTKGINENNPDTAQNSEISALYCQLPSCASGLTGLTDEGSVCTRACNDVQCEDDEFMVPCKFPQDSFCAERHPLKREGLQAKYTMPKEANILNINCEHRVSSFEHALINIDSPLQDKHVCVWNSMDIRDNVYGPAGISRTWMTTVDSTNYLYEKIGTKFCHPIVPNLQQASTQELPHEIVWNKSPRVEYPLLPLQNVVNENRHVFVNTSASVVAYNDGEGDQNAQYFVRNSNTNFRMLIPSRPHNLSGNFFVSLDMKQTAYASLKIPLQLDEQLNEVAPGVSIYQIVFSFWICKLESQDQPSSSASDAYLQLNPSQFHLDYYTKIESSKNRIQNIATISQNTPTVITGSENLNAFQSLKFENVIKITLDSANDDVYYSRYCAACSDKQIVDFNLDGFIGEGVVPAAENNIISREWIEKINLPVLDIEVFPSMQLSGIEYDECRVYVFENRIDSYCLFMASPNIYTPNMGEFIIDWTMRSHDSSIALINQYHTVSNSWNTFLKLISPSHDPQTGFISCPNAINLGYEFDNVENELYILRVVNIELTQSGFMVLQLGKWSLNFVSNTMQNAGISVDINLPQNSIIKNSIFSNLAVSNFDNVIHVVTAFQIQNQNSLTYSLLINDIFENQQIIDISALKCKPSISYLSSSGIVVNIPCQNKLWHGNLLHGLLEVLDNSFLKSSLFSRASKRWWIVPLHYTTQTTSSSSQPLQDKKCFDGYFLDETDVVRPKQSNDPYIEADFSVNLKRYCAYKCTNSLNGLCQAYEIESSGKCYLYLVSDLDSSTVTKTIDKRFFCRRKQEIGVNKAIKTSHVLQDDLEIACSKSVQVLTKLSFYEKLQTGVEVFGRSVAYIPHIIDKIYDLDVAPANTASIVQIQFDNSDPVYFNHFLPSGEDHFTDLTTASKSAYNYVMVQPLFLSNTAPNFLMSPVSLSFQIEHEENDNNLYILLKERSGKIDATVLIRNDVDNSDHTFFFTQNIQTIRLFKCVETEGSGTETFIYFDSNDKDCGDSDIADNKLVKVQPTGSTFVTFKFATDDEMIIKKIEKHDTKFTDVELSIFEKFSDFSVRRYEVTKEWNQIWQVSNRDASLNIHRNYNVDVGETWPDIESTLNPLFIGVDHLEVNHLLSVFPGIKSGNVILCYIEKNLRNSMSDFIRGNDVTDWERIPARAVVPFLKENTCAVKVRLVKASAGNFINFDKANWEESFLKLGCEIGDISDNFNSCFFEIPLLQSEQVSGLAVAFEFDALCEAVLLDTEAFVTLSPTDSTVYECPFSDEFYNVNSNSCEKCTETHIICPLGEFEKGCAKLDPYDASTFDPAISCTPCVGNPNSDPALYSWNSGEMCSYDCVVGYFKNTIGMCVQCTNPTCLIGEQVFDSCQNPGSVFDRSCTPCQKIIEHGIYQDNEFFYSNANCGTRCSEGFYRSKTGEDESPMFSACVPCTDLHTLKTIVDITRSSGNFYKFHQCTGLNNAFSEICTAADSNGIYSADAANFNEDCQISCNLGFQTDYTHNTLQDAEQHPDGISNALSNINAFEQTYVATPPQILWKNSRCRACDPTSVATGVETYEWTENCIPLCNDGLVSWKGDDGLAVLKCLNMPACNDGYYARGSSLEICSSCVTGNRLDSNWEFVPSGSSIPGESSSCPIQCKCGDIAAGEACYFQDENRCILHTSYYDCSANHGSNYYWAVGSRYVNSMCLQCGSCEGKFQSQACTATTPNKCTDCPDTLGQGEFFTGLVCSKECITGFFYNTANSICENCNGFSCAPGSFFAASRSHCEDCTSCAETLPSNAEWINNCTYHCSNGFELFDYEEKSIIDEVETVTTTKICTESFSGSLKISSQTQKINCLSDEYLASSYTCTKCSNSHPSVLLQDETWRWIGFECKWECKWGYVLHQDELGHFFCLSWTEYKQIRKLKMINFSKKFKPQTFIKKHLSGYETFGFVAILVLSLISSFF